MKRRDVLMAGAVLLTARGAVARDTQFGFHFYGAEDCPPCMAFKRNHLEGVREAGRFHGFDVAENIAPNTADVPKVGVYGESDPILRLAAPMLRFVYPPIFFVSQSNTVASVHDHDWEAALAAAVLLTAN